MLHLLENVWRSFVPKHIIGNCEILDPTFIGETSVCRAVYDESWVLALFALALILFFCSIELVESARLVACHPSLRIHWMEVFIALCKWITSSTAYQFVDTPIVVALWDILKHTWRTFISLVPYWRVGNMVIKQIIKIYQTCILLIDYDLVWSAALVFALHFGLSKIVLFILTRFVAKQPTVWVHCKQSLIALFITASQRTN